MPKLNDTQLILLSTAAQREDGSFYPLPATLADAHTRAAKAIAALTKSGLAEERETTDASAVRRADGDIRYGVFATAAGFAAIGACEDGDAGASSAPAPAKPERQTKSGAVITLLEREEGATLAEMIETTGWLPHTTRAVLTGLRKKGHTIARGKRGDDTCYRILKPA